MDRAQAGLQLMARSASRSALVSPGPRCLLRPTPTGGSFQPPASYTESLAAPFDSARSATSASWINSRSLRRTTPQPDLD